MSDAHQVLELTVRSLTGASVERLARLTSGGQNETYRAALDNGEVAIVRVARRASPWFADEEHLSNLAQEAGVPAPRVLGVEHLEQPDGWLSISVQEHVAGRPLAEVSGELQSNELERLLLDCGELLARLHTLRTDRGVPHNPRIRSAEHVVRAAEAAERALGAEAADVVRQGADHLANMLDSRGTPRLVLVHGDFLPPNILIDDGEVASVIDWEFAGPGPPAFDLARWELSPRNTLRKHTDVLHRGYARIADLEGAADGWIGAFAIDYSLAVLSRAEPSREDVRSSVERIARYSAA